MIRILQSENKVTKIIFAVVIGAAIVTMVITLVPGIFDNGGGGDATTYATVRNPGFFGRFSGDSTSIKIADVQRQTQQIVRRNGYPDYAVQILMPRVGQQVVEQDVLVREAQHLGLTVSDADLRRELQTGSLGQYIFPNGQYIGDDKYIDFVETYFGTSVHEFENQVKQELEVQRLRAFITGGIGVSDSAVRADYMKQGTKVKFDYAVISAADLKKSINPSDGQLQAFFKQNASRYATAVPETRKLQLFSFQDSDAPGANAAPSVADIQAYYSVHQVDYKQPEEVQTRHILIAVPAGANSKTDAAAKSKAADVLKQLQAGANFADLAKKYSDDPGSKDKGGELPMMPTAGLDPAYAKAAEALNPGQTSGLVRSQFGYHIIQTIAKQPATEKPLAAVKDQIAQTLQNAKSAAAAQSYATQLAAEAKSKGLTATAVDHNLHVVTTDWVGHDGTIPSLADSTQVLAAAFAASKGAPPQSASTGEGYAIFQVVDIQPAHAPAFADWKSHVLDDYKDQKVPELLNDALTKLDARAKALGDLSKAAAEQNVPVKSSDFVGHDAQVTDVGAMSGSASVAFDLPKGGVSGPLNNGANGVVLQVTDKQVPSADDLAKNLQTTRDKLLADRQDQAFSVFAGEVMERYQKAGAITYQKNALPGGPFGN